MSENDFQQPPVEPTPPGYDTAQTPPPGYEAPATPAAPAASAPPQFPSYPAQAQQQYGQQPVQQQQYQQGMGDPAGTVSLNYWLSVFFSWIPALIFFLTEKGKNGLADEFHKQNMNFSIVRIIVGVLSLIPYIGIIFVLASLALFIFHIIAAVEAPKAFRSGQPYKFVFNIPFIK